VSEEPKEQKGQKEEKEQKKQKEEACGGVNQPTFSLAK